tara:strand:- start:193 stop:726 length:534 start_codon:yes stop_codon:yes gene_type:complete
MIRKLRTKRLFNKITEKSAVLKIGEKIVSIQASEIWKGLQIEFQGKVEINSLLPDDYIVESGVNKIIIVKFNKRDEVLSDLFKYKGKLNILSCIMVSGDLKQTTVHIDKSSMQLWNTLYGSVNKKGETVLKDWAYLGENWEDLDFDGNNNKYSYTYRKQVYDKESKTYTEIKELRKK